MPHYFELHLDTTGPGGPALSINAGGTATSNRNIAIALTTTDPDTTGYEMLVWGDIDGGAAIEGAAVWIPYDPDFNLTVTTGDGTKTISARIRDQVGNPTGIVTDTIELDTVAPTPDVAAPDVERVSIIDGWRLATTSFTVPAPIVAWEVRVAPNTGSLRDATTLIPETNGSNSQGGALAAATPQQIVIDGRDLKLASDPDGLKILKVFVQDENGNWSV